MSETLHLRDEVYAICEKAGLEPGSVRNIIVTPDVVTFDVYDTPKRFENGAPVMVAVTYPWTWDSE